ncbi:type II secretion system protein [Motiliproteus sp. MSK22-1]|uniref:type II secretion system protein n=1 Tax=Motiliproteus sp. MSK22-1 TaxID=1897630 RepID=UPI000975ED47|nr:prepilin-type N-terminal cleavage/methylation domain-containing protein [Motiliproteus sp. MSK22-1]OMH39532.1 hypothetical protein BGP75_02780 [Motiliproteus sp. MSK22-1]
MKPLYQTRSCRLQQTGIPPFCQKSQRDCKYQGGFSLLELLVSAVIILVLVAGAYMRYMELAIDAERAAFKGVIGWLQAGMNMEMGHALTQGGMQNLEHLEHSNPMALVLKVMEPPSNYLGELDQQQALAAEPGFWYFDLHQKSLIYRVRYDQNLEGIDKLDNNKLSFVLKLVYSPADSYKGRRVIRRVRLQPSHKDFWKTPLGSGWKPRD